MLAAGGDLDEGELVESARQRRRATLQEARGWRCSTAYRARGLGGVKAGIRGGRKWRESVATPTFLRPGGQGVDLTLHTQRGRFPAQQISSKHEFGAEPHVEAVGKHKPREGAPCEQL